MGEDGYTWAYKKARQKLLEDRPPCAYCRARLADTADHVPPLAAFPPGEWQGQLVPACLSCNSSLGARFRNERNRPKPKTSRRW
jgi:5-methylcytosine-specific restriction endonuclease McrA